MRTPPPAGPDLGRRLVAELLGTLFLVAIVVGSGVAAQRLTADPGLQLLENSTATVLGLTVLILVLGPVSGAHFNPVVTVAETVLARRDPDGAALPGSWVAAYLGAQALGAVAGAVLANAMFEVDQAVATTDRTGAGLLLGEVVATAGLVVLVLALVRSGRAAIVAPAVGAYIGAAYWFTSSTSFANPAVTLGRVFTDTFAGIAPASLPGFVAAQVVGAALGVVAVAYLYPRPSPPPAECRPDPVDAVDHVTEPHRSSA